MEDKRKIIIIGIIIIMILIVVGIIWYVNYQEEYVDMNIFDENNQAIISKTENETVNNVENESKNTNAIGDNEIFIAIHITGEVKKEGLIFLKQGSRIADAIKQAGGATKNANLDRINLAYILEDGQKIYIPNKNEKEETKAYITQNSGDNILLDEGNSDLSKTEKNVKGVNQKVNINTANQTELETLPGIGPSLAQRILEYRNENGKFGKIEDIQNVKGIGDSKYSNIKDNICI